MLFFTALDLASITSPIHNWVLFLLGPIPSFFLELFLHWSPVAYWAPSDLGSSSLNVLSFCLFILFMGFSRQEYWSGLPFPSPVDHILSDLSLPWPTHLGWPHMAWLSFIKLDKGVVHVFRLASCLWLWFQSVCPLMPSLRAYHLTWITFTLDVRYLFTAAPAKRSRRSLPWMWGSSSRPHSCFVAATALVRRRSRSAHALSSQLQIAVKRREAKSKGEKER